MQYLARTSTTLDGNMAFRYGARDEVLANRERFIADLRLDPNHCVIMDSRHEDVVAVIDATTPRGVFGLARSIVADTLITQLPDTPLLLTTADCLPITLFDPTSETIALVHLSRHTFCLDLLQKTMDVLTGTLGIVASNLTVTIGPHIHKDSYSFVTPLAHIDPKLQPYIEERSDRAYIDLLSAALDVFTHHNMPRQCITHSPIDTYANPYYFSHVRQTEKGETKGRLITVACLQSSYVR